MSAATQCLKQVKNLVFEGGGVKGIAYLGVLEQLYGAMPAPSTPGRAPEQIVGAGGSSAGAITALAVSFGLDYEGTRKIADSLVFSKIPQSPTAADFPNLDHVERDLLNAVEHILPIWSLYAIFHDYGWYSSDYFYSWLKSTIGAQFDSDGTETFAEYKQQMTSRLGRFIDLRVHATDVSTHTTRVFSASTTPTMQVAETIRMSMSIPMFFQAIPLGNDYYCDGGVIANYPIELFDREPGAHHFDTLGFHLFTPPDCAPPKPVDGLVSYIENLFDTIVAPGSIVQPDDRDRTIEISNCCVRTTDFSIAPGSPCYVDLFKSGVQATREWLAHHA